MEHTHAIYRAMAIAAVALLLIAASGGLANVQQGQSIPVTTVPMPEISVAPYPAMLSMPNVTWSKLQPPPSLNTSYITCTLADINMDGHLDIILGHGLGIHVWAGDGAGNWQPFTPPPGTRSFNALEVGDMNNDGKPDIIGASDDGLYVWAGDGMGGWTDISPAYEARPFYSLAIDDLNLDGKMDIVAASRGQGINKAVWVYLGDGTGGWTRSDAGMPTTGTYSGVVTGDFNMDGKPDIVASANGLSTWSGDGSGNWTSRNVGLPTNGIFSDVALRDVDNDGRLDIIAAGQNNGGVGIWKGNGGGMWAPVPPQRLPTSSGNYKALEVLDINIDGYMDIMAVSANSDDTVWTGDGLENWALQTAGMEPGNYHKAVSSGDINSNGRTELCMITIAGEVEIWASHVEREVNSWSAFPAPDTTGIARDMLVFDVDRDGKMDICYALNGKGLELWKGDGNGTWSAFTSPMTTGNFNRIVSVDFNKDGYPDIIATSDAGVRSWRGDGSGGWTVSGTSTNNVWLGLAAADLNNDGNIDFVAGTGTNQGLRQFNGNGAGGWTPRPVLPFTGNYHSIDIADMNRDGAMDIVAANGGIKVFLGNGNDVWTDSSAGLPGASDGYREVRIADLNNDGFMDIIGASITEGVNVWLGNGTGLWGTPMNIIPGNAAGLAIADFSIDGKLDICVGSDNGNGISGSRNGEFTWKDASNGLSRGGDFAALVLADMNIDGRLDIITFNNSDQKPYIWTGEYAQPPPSIFTIGPLSVGWNLVSTPLVPLNASLPDALTDLDGDTSWTRMKYYDNSVHPPRWRTHAPGISGTLHEINMEMGFWIFIPDGDSLGDGYIRLEGYESTSTAITLASGWNLVGYPSSTPMQANLALPPQVDMIAISQPVSPYIQDIYDLSSVELVPGNAYWVHVTSACVWSVEY